jgi:tRNA(fMet)-specific endonuclease VapC
LRTASSTGKGSCSSVTEPRFLLDTNICIYLAEGLSEPLLNRVEQCPVGELATSAISFAEFTRGVDWSQPHAEDSIARLFQAITIVSFDRAAAIAYAALPFVRHRFDRLIAAHALSLGVTLVTANERDFRDIPDLRVEDWTR